ncbi:ESPR-type extended signal peptide-containing protein [uncultured Turicimonas sp.]|uniref:ESPR domain-containing protein n=1 Tax=uncultured Turicimonas sp. TaxID=1918607 RepID=UPI0028038F03|nr:ESPR-type extended signal peptide-containing protein [uncultured Turicimonas sp.]
MNKIFKKIWNKARGCFVAVSEVAAASSKKGGKNALVGTIAFLLPLTSYAVQTINGDVELGTLKENVKNTLRDSYIINGNATASADSLHVSWTSKDFRGMEDQTLTVNGNLTVTSPYMVITHRGDGASQITGGLHVRDNLYLDAGLLRVGSGNSHDGGTVNTSFSVGGTLRVAQGATIDNRSDYFYVHLNMSAGTLDFSGNLDISTVETGTINYGNMIVRNGSYKQTNNVQTYASNSLSLLGGSLTNESSLVVGVKSGQFSVGNSLTLGGGNLTNRNLLTQIAGNINITGGSYDFGTFNKSNGTLGNAGTLTVTQFNQSGGSASNTGNLTIGNADLYGSLTSSGTLALTGNVISRGNLSSTGTLNNRGSWTETNAFTIAGNLNNTGAINFQNGFALAAGSKLNSSGTIQTNNASNIFDSLGSQGQTALTTVSMNAQLPEEAKTALTDLFRHYVPGSVAQNLAEHATFTGGKVIVTGVNLTQTQADDLKKEFKSKFVVFEFYRLSSFSSSRRTK